MDITIFRSRQNIFIKNIFYRKYALWYYSLVQATVICIILNAIFMDFMKGNLTFKAWIPFDYTSPIIFFFVFTHQIIGMSICATVNVACDSLISGFLQEICCQLEILEYRLTKISYDQHILYNCIRHHDRIYELVFKIILLFLKYLKYNHYTQKCLFVRSLLRNSHLKVVRKLLNCLFHKKCYERCSMRLMALKLHID